MGVAAVPVILTFLLMLFAWQVVFSSNRDLVRARAWGELARRLLPFAAIIAMTASLPLAQGQGADWGIIWALAFGAALVASNFFSRPLDERRASRAFRNEDYTAAAALYRKLVAQKPLARYWASLGAALGLDEQHEKSVDASTHAVELDPKYGLAYYNRALILRKMGRKSRAAKDLKRAIDVDLPRRFRAAAGKLLEEV